jgi:hypothetical protein
MGNNQPINSYIEVKSPFFQPGGMIHGIVNIHVKEGTTAAMLCVKLTGKELTRWTEQKSAGKSSYTEFLRGNHKVIDVSFPIWDFGGSVSEGQFTVPFVIQTPQWLPPSFRYKALFRKAKLYYRLRAYVDDKKKTRAHKNKIWSSVFPPPVEARNVFEEMLFDVRNFCCFKQGYTKMNGYLNRHFAQPTHQLTVTGLIDNTDGRKRVKKVTAYLHRSIRMHVNKGFYKGRNKTFTDEYLRDHIDVHVEPGQVMSKEEPISLTMDLSKVEFLWQFPTLKSVIIECEHTIVLKLDFNNFWGCRYYKINLPIDIYNGEVGSVAYSLPPPEVNFEWKPVSLSEAPIQSTMDIPIPEEYGQSNPEKLQNQSDN